MADKIQFRRDTAERWREFNPILAEGELGFVLNSSNYKIGDGVHEWNDLPLEGFNGNFVDKFGNDENSVISQAALTNLFKRIISNNSHIDVSEGFNKLNLQNENIEKASQSCGLYVLTNGIYSVGYMLVIFENFHNSITQLLFGNFSIENGELYNDTNNINPNILIRSAKFSNEESESSIWDKWRYIQDYFIKNENNLNFSELSSVPSLILFNSTISTINKEIQSIKNNYQILLNRISRLENQIV